VETEGFMMVRVSEVSVIEQPHISVVQDFIVGLGEEVFEVGSRLAQVSQPDQGGKVLCSSFDELTSQLNLVVIGLVLGFRADGPLGGLSHQVPGGEERSDSLLSQ
jgi:hypothetical protein